MKKHIIVLSIIFLLGLYGFSQEITLLSKEDLTEKVFQNSKLLKISEKSYQEAQADYRQTKAVFLPNITASHTAMATTNPLMAFGSKLNQEILTANDFNPILLNDPSQIENFATKIEIQQPIINIDGIYQRKAAKSKMQAKDLQTQRTKQYLELEVEKSYMQLQLAYKAVEVMEETLLASEENLKLAKNSYKQGYLQKADVLAVEVRLTEVKSHLQNAQSNVANASNYLSFLMDEDSYTMYKPVDSLYALGIAQGKSVTVPSERADIKAMMLASEAYKANNRADNMAFLPRLNAFGSYELYDDEIFQAGANGYTVGAQLSWNIFEGSKRFAKSQKSKAEYERSQLEYEQYKSQSQLELNKAIRMLDDAKSKLELTQLALDQSKESLRIRANRFKEGLEKTTDLLMAETQYAQKQLDYYQTVFEYNYALAYIEFLTQ